MNDINSAVTNSSRAEVHTALNRMNGSAFSSGHWLLNTNQYKINTISQLRSISRTTLTAPNSIDLKEYISASSIIHCSDGWSYLSESISALLNGQTGCALHFAYYAELRAAMSFLACQGIGIFENEHYYISSTGSCNKFNSNGNFSYKRGNGTHQIAWKTLSAWAQNPSHATYFLSLIKIKGISLDNWVNSFLGGPSTSALLNIGIVSSWLQAWNLDISRIELDRDVRNVASYRPYQINSTNNRSFESDLNKIMSFQKLLEPVGSEKFRRFDYNLLKEAFILIHPQIASTSPDYEDCVLRTVALYPSDSILNGILVSPARHDISIEAGKNAITASDEIDPIPVISRALLMLRISTAACEDTLTQAGLGKAAIQFWTNKLISETGLGLSGSVSEFSDLWSDKEFAIDSLEDYMTQTTDKGIQSTYFNKALEMHTLKQFHASFLWGLGI